MYLFDEGKGVINRVDIPGVNSEVQLDDPCHY